MFKLGFKSTFKSAFNFKSWIGWDSLAQNSSWIRSMFTALVKVQKTATVKETFEEAVKKYGYTPDFLAEQSDKLRLAARIYGSALGLGITYMVWLFYKKLWMAFIVMGTINFLIFSYYFRERFWLMQIQHKKLGMTMQDWFRYTVLRNG